LFKKIDAVSYSRRSRMLKEAEDYAVRLLMSKFSESEAELLARDLVKRYSTHGFVIDSEECKRLGASLDENETRKYVGLHASAPKTPDLAKAVDDLYNAVSSGTALGKLVPI
jgi:hypothetical protein